MMFCKAKLFDDPQVAEKILSAKDPGEQKALGRRVRGFSDEVWDQHKVDIVYRINYEKFFQNKGLRRKLFSTGNRKLMEASPVDIVWGIGLDSSAADSTPEAEWPGQNLLGKVLTRVRDELKVVFPIEFSQVSQN